MTPPILSLEVRSHLSTNLYSISRLILLDTYSELERKADTVVLTRVTPPTSNIHESLLPQIQPEILEKPASKADDLRMLLDLNGGMCEVVTGVTVGECSAFTLPSFRLVLLSGNRRSTDKNCVGNSLSYFDCTGIRDKVSVCMPCGNASY